MGDEPAGPGAFNAFTATLTGALIGWPYNTGASKVKTE